ncbi:hypothetical protein MPH_00720 [Macrophomina phaseolina MS6]|uniref:Uncharacterized protein n=1 Tax=Macrophomina phaseolina (strain MS6) TaxID=1126212 RepID=K2RGY1_MACPH|nr:hypothetical protein MPH_00720 [Macrophomina phaseolina MS6]
MSGSIPSSFGSAPNSPTSSGPATPARRRSSIFSGIANLSISGSSSSNGSQSRRASKWSISSCFSQSSNPDKQDSVSMQDFSPPASPLSSTFDQSTIASRRRSYVPKRAAESFSISTTPVYAREAGCTSVSSLGSKRMSYATQYGFKMPSERMPMKTVSDSKE